MKKYAVLCLGFLLAFQCLFSIKSYAATKDDYTLEKVVVYSRHNIRAPLNITPDSLLFNVTTHKWVKWSEKSGELSSLGGELETLMGQYFRKWLESEKFIPENYIPQQGETRFYANSVQRTIATTKYFSAGMLPVANVDVEWHFPLNNQDTVFFVNFKSITPTDSFKSEMARDLKNMGGAEKLSERVAGDVALIEQVLDFKNSAYAKKNKLQSFHKKGEADFTVTFDKGLRLGGAIRPAMSAADALILQYYEEPAKSAFGRSLTYKEWQGIGRLNSLGLYAIFHMPSLSAPAVKPTLKTIKDELLLPNRKFTFLCGHDLGIVAFFSALGIEDYELPDSIEPLTPVGSKFIVEKRRGKDGKAYAALKLMYLTTKQIHNREILSLANPPRTVPLHLKGLTTNSDGLYLFDDVIARLSKLTGE